jgi:hypothetical protein
MTRIRRIFTFLNARERDRFWLFALLYVGVLFLVVLATQANGAAPSKVDGGPDTPPAVFALPPASRIAGADNQTAAEARTLRAARRGDTAAAMRAVAPVLAARFALPTDPAIVTCAGQNPSRFTCGMRSGHYQVVVRVMVAPSSHLVVTRGWVKYRGTPIASAWAADYHRTAREMARHRVTFSMALRTCARWLVCIRRPAFARSVERDLAIAWDETPNGPDYRHVSCSGSTDGSIWNAQCRAGLGWYATATFHKRAGGIGTLYY